MSFAQELTCRWSTSTWTPTRLLPARSLAQNRWGWWKKCVGGVDKVGETDVGDDDDDDGDDADDDDDDDGVDVDVDPEKMVQKMV